MTRALALIVATLAPFSVNVPSAPETDRCAAPVIVAIGTEPVGCNVSPPSRIDVIAIGETECARLGGTYSFPFYCTGLDY